MDKLLELAVKEFTNGNIIAVLVVVLLFLAVNYQRLWNLFLERRRVKIEILEKSLAEPNVQGLTKKHLQELIETEYFHAATGLRLDRRFREIVIDIFNRGNGSIRFDHFRRAQQYFNFVGDKLEVNIGLGSWLTFAYNAICGVGCFLVFVFSFIFPVFMEDKTLPNLLPVYSLGLFSFSMSIVFFFLSLPHISAFYVKSILDEQQELGAELSEEEQVQAA